MKKLKDPINVIIGKRLKTRRKELKIKTQTILAELIGTDRETIARWEAGVHGISNENMAAIKVALKVEDSFFDPFNSTAVNAELQQLRSEMRELRKKLEELTKNSQVFQKAVEPNSKKNRALTEAEQALIPLLKSLMDMLKKN